MSIPYSRRAALLGGLVVALVTACVGEEREHTVRTVSLADGSYRVAYGYGHAPEDEARILATTAALDREAGRLVIRMADGSEQELSFVPRPRAGWFADCYTMGGHTDEEVADLSPSPVHVESLTFASPIVYAKCGPGRMILSNDPPEEGRYLAFDLQ